MSAVQSEYSLFTRDPEAEVLPTCRELGIGFVAYSPLGRGILSGAVTRPDQFADDDFRAHTPRFQADNLARNVLLVERLGAVASTRGCTPAQLALAWVLAQGDDIVPIPGTKRRRWLEEDVAALAVELTAEEMAAIEAIAPPGAAVGDRYPPEHMARVNV